MHTYIHIHIPCSGVLVPGRPVTSSPMGFGLRPTCECLTSAHSADPSYECLTPRALLRRPDRAMGPQKRAPGSSSALRGVVPVEVRIAIATSDSLLECLEIGCFYPCVLAEHGFNLLLCVCISAAA